MQPVDSPQPLPVLVYDAILNGICEGTLQSGQRLTQEELAERLNVSRLPVGQALQWLKAEGFVCSAGKRGVKVTPLSPELVRDLYEFRSGVDMFAAGAAAERAAARQQERGREIVEEGRSALAAGDIPMLIGADIDFHQLIYEMAGNEVITDVMGARWKHIRRIMSAIIDDTENQIRIWQEHEAILDAVAAGDRSRAERLARAHVDDASHWLQQQLAEDTAVNERTG